MPKFEYAYDIIGTFIGNLETNMQEQLYLIYSMYVGPFYMINLDLKQAVLQVWSIFYP